MKKIWLAVLVLLVSLTQVPFASADLSIIQPGPCPVIKFGNESTKPNTFNLGDNYLYCFPADFILQNGKPGPYWVRLDAISISQTRIIQNQKDDVIVSLFGQTNAANIDLSKLLDLQFDSQSTERMYSIPNNGNSTGTGKCDYGIHMNPEKSKLPDSTGAFTAIFIGGFSGCPVGDYSFAAGTPFDGQVEGIMMLKSLKGNLISIVPSEGFAVLGAGCKNLSQIGLLKNGSQTICAQINGKKIWSAIPGGKLQTPAVQSNVQKQITIKAGASCKTAGQISNAANGNFVCAVKGKSKVWVFLDGGTNPVKTSTQSTTKSSLPAPSKADQLKQTGCNSFPNAISTLQHASGGNYNSALINAQNVAGNIKQASLLDSKYALLDSAQYTIIQYAQATGWGGVGYNGDVNSVRAAIATFNAGCKTNLTLN